MKIAMQLLCLSAAFAYTALVAYSVGKNHGLHEYKDFIDKLEWISDCQYKGNKIRNRTDCEILYLEKLKGE